MTGTILNLARPLMISSQSVSLYDALLSGVRSSNGRAAIGVSSPS
jgi:hypothetical protein